MDTIDRLLIPGKSGSSSIDEETEEDRKILREQEKFMKKFKDNKIQPAAKIVGSDKSKNIAKSPTTSNDDDDVQDKIANTFEFIPKKQIMGPVVEKRKNEDDNAYNTPLVFCNTGFPKAKRRDVTIRGGTGSIFAQQMRKKRSSSNVSINATASTSRCEENVIQMDVDNNTTENIQFNIPSRVVTQSKILTKTEKEEIHEHNIGILKNTPESEILEEKEKLMSTMDPALIAFLKSRRKEMKPKSTNQTITEQNEAGQNLKLEDIETTTEILNIPGSDKWLNFNMLETHKLAWMKEFEIPKIEKDKAFEARFDFEGWLLPFSVPEMNEKNRILYHHGEEPERPGYTLKELFTLARSNVTQQKIIALNSIANILYLYSTGVYQDILEVPIEQIFFLIRFCLDDNSPGVLNASIKAMRCLVYNYSDEICLDCLLGFGFEDSMPILPVDHEKKDDDRENDQQLAEKNMIRCLVRTGIYTRIRYILNTIRPAIETIVYCLEILIRLGEDSDLVVSEMFKCDNLIPSIVKNFIPSSYSHGHKENAYGAPVLQAVKLVRVLASRNTDLAKKFVDEYSIVENISPYLQDETFGSNVSTIKAQTECFHLLRLLLRYGMTIEYSSSLECILLKHLDYHVKQTNISDETTYVREGHCSAVLALLGTFLSLKPSLVYKFEDLYRIALKKWCTQFQRSSDFKCGKSQIISSLISLSSKIYGYSKLTRYIEHNIADLLRSSGFTTCLSNIQNCSMLLNNYEPHPFSPNLKTLQTAAWYAADHVIPILQTSSCLPFFRSLSQFISCCSSILLKLSFLEDPQVKAYIKDLSGKKSLFLASHWFTRVESQVILNILKISIDVSKEVDTSVFYALAVKSLCIFSEDQKKDIEYILEKIVFCSNFYPSEVLLDNLHLSEKHEELKISVDNLYRIKQVYSKSLGLTVQRNPNRSLCLDIGIGNIIPIDWVYSPILILYSDQQGDNDALPEEQQEFIVKNCLRWVLLYEMYFPSLLKIVNPTERFCRLACVFLGSDDIFFNEKIHHLLKLCFMNLVFKFGDKFDFDKPIKGLTNFQDFYIQLLEHYQGISYGDCLFGNFLIVPLAQKQNIQWRKTLWSEYIGVAQIMNVSREQLVSPLENYLQPLEEDESLLNCYKNALLMNTVKPTSVLYHIAAHHCTEYMKKHSKPQ